MGQPTSRPVFDTHETDQNAELHAKSGDMMLQEALSTTNNLSSQMINVNTENGFKTMWARSDSFTWGKLTQEFMDEPSSVGPGFFYTKYNRVEADQKAVLQAFLKCRKEVNMPMSDQQPNAVFDKPFQHIRRQYTYLHPQSEAEPSQLRMSCQLGSNEFNALFFLSNPLD